MDRDDHEARREWIDGAIAAHKDSDAAWANRVRARRGYRKPEPEPEYPCITSRLKYRERVRELQGIRERAEKLGLKPRRLSSGVGSCDHPQLPQTTLPTVSAVPAKRPKAPDDAAEEIVYKGPTVVRTVPRWVFCKESHKFISDPALVEVPPEAIVWVGPPSPLPGDEGKRRPPRLVPVDRCPVYPLRWEALAAVFAAGDNSTPYCERYARQKAYRVACEQSQGTTSGTLIPKPEAVSVKDRHGDDAPKNWKHTHRTAEQASIAQEIKNGNLHVRKPSREALRMPEFEREERATETRRRTRPAVKTRLRILTALVARVQKARQTWFTASFTLDELARESETDGKTLATWVNKFMECLVIDKRYVAPDQFVYEVHGGALLRELGGEGRASTANELREWTGESWGHSHEDAVLEKIDRERHCHN